MSQVRYLRIWRFEPGEIMRNRYFVCYDVSDPQRLARAYKKMQGYGDPVQYSVFDCSLNEKEIIYLKEDLEEILNLKEDRVLVINSGRIGKKTDKHVFTLGIPLEKKESTVVI